MNNNTLFKLLNGIKYSLNIANRAIPIYTEAKPLLKKGIDTYNNIKNNKTFNTLFKTKKIQIGKKDYNSTKYISKDNNPKFFI